MKRPQGIRLLSLDLGVLVVNLGQQGPDLMRELLQKKARKQVGLLLPPGSHLQHGSHHLQRLFKLMGGAIYSLSTH